MTTKTKTKPAPGTKTQTRAKPDAHHALPPLSPHLVCDGAAKAIDFYKKAFGATEIMRLPTKDGRLLHAAIEINGARVMLVDEFPEMCAQLPAKGSAVTLHLYVNDVDAVVKRAIDAGAKEVMPVADMFWGDRYGIIEDPFGHRWSIATQLRQMTTAEIQAAVDCMPM